MKSSKPIYLIAFFFMLVIVTFFLSTSCFSSNNGLRDRAGSGHYTETEGIHSFHL